MSEIYDENSPLYGSRGIDTYLKLIRKRYSHINIDELLAYAGMEPYQVRDEAHFFSQLQINRFYEKLVELTGNKNIAREAGRYAASPDAFDNAGRFALGLITPVRFCGLMNKYAHKITRSGSYLANVLNPNKVEITVTPYPGVKEEPYQCENRMGYWESMTMLFKLKPARIEHPECLFRGDSSCRYIVSWPKSPVTYLQRARNTALAVLGLLCLFFPVLYLFHSSPHTIMTGSVFAFVLLTTAILTINIFLKKIETENLVDTIERLRLSSDNLSEQVEINYENSLLINEIGQTLARESETKGIFTGIMKIISKRLDYDRALILLVGSDQAELKYQASYGYNDELVRILSAKPYPLHTQDPIGLFAATYYRKKPQLFNDIEEMKSIFPQGFDGIGDEMDIQSMICCPIMYENEVLGILAVDNVRRKSPLLQRDLNLIMGIAMQIGSRLHNVKLESHIRQMQKMEAVGNLAGGVAHDFNNILSTILGYSQMLTLRLKPDDPEWKMADDIHQAGLKASQLTQQLLAFSRKQVIDLRVTNINTIVEEILKMLGRLIGEDIIIQPILASSTGNILGDSSQIGQILINLVVNARDAMPQGGKITIETGDIYLDENYAGEHEGVEAGHYAQISVTDTGEGITADKRDKIFEPFFTTKEPGKGTGLGLSTVYGIVRQHKGHINVYSEPGHGTCFKVYFPIVDEDIEEKNLHDILMPATGGNETILVVDDDESVRTLVLDTLQPLGYNILMAENGNDALEQCAAREHRIDLVLSDVIMPGMNGRQLVDALKDQCPYVRTVLMSGYTDNILKQQGVVEENYILINKPLLPTALANKVREVLDMEIAE